MAGRYGCTVAELKKTVPQLLVVVESPHEFNPMLGLRGCRPGILYPEITEMQARAIFQTVVQVAKKGVKVIPEVMIPLIGGVKELENQKALTADQVAGEAEFFSFGTNDLTQTSMGLSRDDYVKFSKIYEDKKIFKADPFAVLDQEGVRPADQVGDRKGPQDSRRSRDLGSAASTAASPVRWSSATGRG